jgi:hypothetical protein
MYRTIDGGGNERWFNDDNQLHREDGPAVDTGVMQLWYRNGELHREDGPAFVNKDREEWWSHGIITREDGPAIIYTGWHEVVWSINHKNITTEVNEWIKENNISWPFSTDEEKILFKMRFC